MIQLTKGNANIQKIVVFENAFEKLLEVIFEEGSSDGGTISAVIFVVKIANTSQVMDFFSYKIKNSGCISVCQ